MLESTIADNLKLVLARIADAATRAERNPNEITLVAVSKTHSVETILAAHAAGIRHFGENRVEEAAEKIPLVNQRLPTNQATIQLSNYPTIQLPTWHLVGHLQSRKTRDAAMLFDFIQSIDSVALAKKLNDRVAALGKKIPILLEVNVSGEASKYGFAPDPHNDFVDAVREIIALPNLDAQGLMTVAPIAQGADDAQPRSTFRALRALRDELRREFPNHALPHLSMGMTDDFEIAIAEGATMVRIGRAIFGERKSPGEK